MTGVTILREAEVELWKTVAYYEDKSRGLGLAFQTEVERSVQTKTIAEHPERWPVRADSTRRYLTYRFPYVVVYTYQSDHVWIVVVAHCKRRSAYWTGRIRRVEQGDLGD